MITIRKAEKNDIVAIAAVWQESFLASYTAFMPTSYIEKILSTNFIGTTVRASWRQWFLAENGTTVAGIMQLQKNYIAELWTHPNEQKKGVGSAMLAYAEKNIQEQGLTTITLHTYGKNTYARAFYRNRGFLTKRIEASDRIADEIVCFKVKQLLA